MYHPDYWMGRDDGHRPECWRRLDLLKKHIKGGSLHDLGCSEGFYSFGFWGICHPIIAIELDSRLYQKCIKTQGKHKTDIHFFNENVLGMPNPQKSYWDNILYMSIHHHIMEQIGMEDATEFLNKLSTDFKQMFFDMGQKNENCPQHEWHRLLPDTDDPEGWTYDYLKENTAYNDITRIGSSTIHGVQRILWKLANS